MAQAGTVGCMAARTRDCRAGSESLGWADETRGGCEIPHRAVKVNARQVGRGGNPPSTLKAEQVSWAYTQQNKEKGQESGLVGRLVGG